jgi:hypothetical protein
MFSRVGAFLEAVPFKIFMKKLLALPAGCLLALALFADPPPGAAWLNRYDGPVHFTDSPTVLAVDPTGAVTVSGHSVDTNSITSAATLRYDAAGNLLWETRLGNDEVHFWQPKGLEIDSNGQVVMITLGEPNGNQSQARGVRFSPGGSVTWQAVLANISEPTGVALDSTNNAYFLYRVFDFEENSSFRLESRDPADGVRWNSLVTQIGFMYSVISTPLDDIFALGFESFPGPALIERYDTAGAHISFSTNTLINPLAIAADSSGNIYLAAKSSFTTNAVAKLTRDFHIEWTVNIPGSGSRGMEPTAFAVDAIGNSYLAGKALVSGQGYNFRTVKISPSGFLLWSKDFDGAAHMSDEVTAIAVDDAGGVYVTGSSQAADGFKDFATVKFDANGNRLWALTYDGPAGEDDIPSVIRVTAAHEAVVAGSSVGIGTFEDYAVIKYLPLEDKRFLSVDVAGEGDVEKDPEKAFYEPGDMVTLTAVPRTNQAFLRWSGGIQSTNPVVSVTLSSNIVALAQFTPAALLSFGCSGAECLTNLTLNLTGERFARYEVQTSTNLVQWTPLTIVTNQNNVEPVGPIVPSAAQTFYRAVLLP